MLLRRCYLAQTTICVVFALPGAHARAQPLTLREILATVLKDAPILDSKLKAIGMKEANITDKRAQFLPQLGFQSKHGIAGSVPREHDEDGKPKSPWASSAAVEATQVFYDSGKSLTEEAAAQLELDAERLGYDETRDKLLLDVAEQFVQLSLKQVLLDDAKQKLVLVRSQYDFVDLGYREGLRQKKDVLRLRAQLQRADTAVNRAVTEVDLASSKLKVLAGKSADTPLEFATVPPGALVIPQDDTRVDLENFYTLKRLQYELEIQRVKVDQIKRQYSPEVKLAANVGYGAASYLGNEGGFKNRDRLSYGVALQLNVPLWDWHVSAHQVQGQVDLAAIKANEITTERNVLSDTVKGLTLSLASARRNYRTSEELFKTEQESFASVEGEYKRGKIAYLDLINALDALSSARQEFVQASYEILSAQIKILYYQRKIYGWALG